MRMSKTGLFLMETMFAILFFAVAGAVCLQLFARAHLFSQDAMKLNEAVTVCQSAASILESEGPDVLPEIYTDGNWENDCFTAPLTNSCILMVSQDGDSYDIRVLDKETEIFSLQLLKKK